MRLNLFAAVPCIALMASSFIVQNAAQATLIGNAMSLRAAPSDGVSNLLYTNFVPMPGKGEVDAVSIFFQGSVSPFQIFQLRPSGPPNNYLVVYDSGAIIPTGILNTPSLLPFPNGTTEVLGGDLFAHFGAGIPYSDTAGLNAVNIHAIYYPTGPAPIAGNIIVLGSGSFPQNNSFIRDYAWAVDFEAAVPEPSTFALLGLGLVGMSIRRRRRRAAA